MITTAATPTPAARSDGADVIGVDGTARVEMCMSVDQRRQRPKFGQGRRWALATHRNTIR